MAPIGTEASFSNKNDQVWKNSDFFISIYFIDYFPNHVNMGQGSNIAITKSSKQTTRKLIFPICKYSIKTV